MRITKNRIITLICFLAITTLIYFEMKVWAPNRFSLHFETVTSSKIPASFDGVSIAVLSDINSDTDNFKKAVEAIEAYSPELILFAGNVIASDVQLENSDLLTELLSQLDAPLGKFAILSQDEPDTSRMLLQTTGFTILNNQLSSVYSSTKEKINLIGFNDNISVKSDESYTFGLTYDPALLDSMTSLKLDTVVAGKTHVGHVNIPFIGSLLHDHKHSQRRSELNGYDLILTSGIGTRSPQVRLLSSPDVLIVQLKSSQ